VQNLVLYFLQLGLQMSFRGLNLQVMAGVALRLPALGPPKFRDTLLQEIFPVSKAAAASLQEHGKIP
jgi:hypothetical protein